MKQSRIPSVKQINGYYIYGDDRTVPRLSTSFHEFVAYINGFLPLRIEIGIEEVREKESPQDSEHDEEFEQYHEPQRTPQRHAAETVPHEARKTFCNIKKSRHRQTVPSDAARTHRLYHNGYTVKDNEKIVKNIPQGKIPIKNSDCLLKTAIPSNIHGTDLQKYRTHATKPVSRASY